MLVLVGALSGVTACGTDPAAGPTDDQSLTIIGGSTTPEAVPSPTPTEMPTETAAPLDLSALSADDRAILEHYLGPDESGRYGEGSWVFAAPLTVDEAMLRLLGPEPLLATPADADLLANAESSAYAFLQVGDGVIAYEDTGFADPPRRLMAALSRDGVVSAVATDNVEAMVRFGYARDGRVVFDSFEYAFVDDLAEIPAEVRDLAALAWVDLDAPIDELGADWLSVALAMSEKVTGVRADESVYDGSEWFLVPLPWAAAQDG
jgi:Family of unknown function (DUF6461)